MRLTLATLLAYLDNVLEPADAQVLHEKIEKSDFASGLVMRIRSVSRKLRMSAPKVEGKGLGRDPNSVAEYLDGSLAPERLGEFERLCLESDVQLAEVASCHQVLAMVLNKPADVPAPLRERIYGLASQAEAARLAAPNRIDPSHAARAESMPSADGKSGAPPLPPKPSSAASSSSLLAVPSDNGKVAEPAAPPVAKSPEIPDYLRASQSPALWVWFAGAAAVFLLCFGLLRLLGPFDNTHPIARLMGMGPAVAVAPSENVPPENVSPPVPVPTAKAAVRPVLPMPLPVQPMPVPGDQPVVPMPPVALPVNPIPEQPAPMPMPKPADPAEVRPEVPPPPVPVPGSVPGDKPVEPLKPIDSVKPEDPKLPVPPPPVPVVPANPSETVDVGRFTSDEQVLARLVTDPKSNMALWQRLAPRSMLIAGERLVVLPTYRPQLTLPAGIQATFAGESAFRMEKPAQANARITVEYGRLILASVGATGGQVELNLGGIAGVVSLADADAAIAIEVRRYLPPGAPADNPKTELIRVVDLFATSGRVVWQPAEGAAVEIPANHVTMYVADEFPRNNVGPFELPAWTDAKSLPDIERRASLDMEAETPLDRPLDISLAEHAAGRRVEVRSLAARSLAALDQFEAILGELNDPRQYSYWAADIDSLRFAISRSSDSAARVLATLRNQRPQNAAVIYEMLLGASDEQLAGGSAATLIKSLESNEVDVRVVALDSLRRTTGLMLMYRPEKPLASNSSSILKWKEKLKDNAIINRVAPNPLNEYKALQK